MKLESLSAAKFEPMDKAAMAFIVGGGNNISGSGTYNGVKSSTDYVDCAGKVYVGSHDGNDFTEKEIKNLTGVECPAPVAK